MEARGLVAITHEQLGWAGDRAYGRLVSRWERRYHHLPTAQVEKVGEPWPLLDRGRYSCTNRRTGFVGG